MQGIEPKIHTSLIERMKYYSDLIKNSKHESCINPEDAHQMMIELNELYEDYLSKKRNLEKSIKNTGSSIRDNKTTDSQNTPVKKDTEIILIKELTVMRAY